MYSKVVSSGATMPARAPPSIDMLQTLIRSSIDIARKVEPVYSRTWPVPPSTPSRLRMPSATSLAATPTGSSPSTRTSIVPGLLRRRHWVASTCSTSEVPMPSANAPKAPWVEVWLSPQAITVPGRVRPSSGPMMWTMPW